MNFRGTMKKERILFLAVIGLFIAGAVYAFLFVKDHGFSARAEPAWYEKWLARNARKIATPSDARELKNTNPVSEAGMAEAREHFVKHCAVCHGVDGRGDSIFGRNMYPKVPDMTDTETQGLTDGELFYIINNGVRFTGMPAFGSEDSPESIWDLVALIRRLPQLSPEEMKELQRLAAGEGGDMEGDESAKDGEAKPHTHPPGTKPHRHR